MKNPYISGPDAARTASGLFVPLAAGHDQGAAGRAATSDICRWRWRMPSSQSFSQSARGAGAARGCGRRGRRQPPQQRAEIGAGVARPEGVGAVHGLPDIRGGHALRKAGIERLPQAAAHGAAKQPGKVVRKLAAVRRIRCALARHPSVRRPIIAFIRSIHPPIRRVVRGRGRLRRTTLAWAVLI